MAVFSLAISIVDTALLLVLAKPLDSLRPTQSKTMMKALMVLLLVALAVEAVSSCLTPKDLSQRRYNS